MILCRRQVRAEIGQHPALANEERVGKVPRITEDGGKKGTTRAAVKALPKGRARAARRVMEEDRVYSVLRLGRAEAIGPPVVVGDGRIVLGKVSFIATLTICGRYTSTPLAPRQGSRARAGPRPFPTRE